LYYNPYQETRTFSISIGAGAHDLYDLEDHRFIQNEVQGETSFALPPEAARVFTILPAGGKRVKEGDRLVQEGVVVDWGIG
jgi:hypothetical protein